MELLAVRNIVKRYANHTALDDVSLSVTEGRIFGLLGPNGAGKTSLIRIINQITGPDSGEILFNGKILSQEHIAQIGYLPEERGLYKKMEVGEQALYLAQLKGLSKKEAETKLRYWFEKFEIQGWWYKKVEELSKGMAQKIQFVVTVLHQPKLLILDEPFSGFDPINANLLKDEILNLRREGSTIIFSTHNMSSVEELCDDIALIDKSKKILDGTVSDIRREYRNQTYQIEFSGSIMAFTNALWTGAELLHKPIESDEVKQATIRIIPPHNTNELLQALLPAVKIIGLKEVIPSMNDIFIKKVSQTSPSGTIANGSNFTE